MLFFSNKSNAALCNTINKAYNWNDSIYTMGNQQIIDGWRDTEYSAYIEDNKVAKTIANIGDKYRYMGIEFSTNALRISDELESIAKAHGCHISRKG